MPNPLDSANPRGGKISARLSRKGPLVEETYRTLQHWDPTNPARQNFADILASNPIGAPNRNWLKEILSTISSRFPAGPPLALITLAKTAVPMEIWKPCLLWNSANSDLLYYRFATEWLYDAFLKHAPLLRTEDLVPFVETLTKGAMQKNSELSDYGKVRTARDLFMAASHFGLVEGRSARRFAHYSLPEAAFLYVAHAIAETEGNGRRLLDSPDWRLFLLSPAAVERRFHELHQFRKVTFEIAGSIVNLRLPYPTLAEYAAQIALEDPDHV